MKPAVFMMLLTVLSCGKKATADLGMIYNRVASFHDEHRNPIIVIPGILGSKLVDGDSGRVVWGAFGGGAINPESPEGARIIALPFNNGTVGFAELSDQVEAAGVLDTLKIKMMGLPVQLNAYLNILHTLGVGGYRDQDLGLGGAVDYGEDHFTCFQFGYDWRRDIVETAAQLHRFIVEKKAYVRAEYLKRYGVEKDIKFDIVAHSMGGLVARYYLRYGDADLASLGAHPKPNWAGAASVEKVILVGTPNAGSLNSLETLIKGRRFAPFLPGYAAAVTGTFPSLYQMLPRTRHGAVIAAENHELKLDILDPKLWVAMGWGLADPKQQERIMNLVPAGLDWERARALALKHQARALENAGAFFKAMDVSAEPPSGVVINLVAGDADKTAAVMAIDRDNREALIVKYNPGDGSVLRSSVLMDERLAGSWQAKLVSPIKMGALLLLNADHLGMTMDPSFTNNILFYLLEQP